MTPRLIGFLDPLDREFFEAFTTVPGVGFMKALKCLVRPMSELRAVVLQASAAPDNTEGTPTDPILAAMAAHTPVIPRGLSSAVADSVAAEPSFVLEDEPLAVPAAYATFAAEPTSLQDFAITEDVAPAPVVELQFTAEPEPVPA